VGFYRDQVLPRAMNVLLSSKEFGNVRERVASGLSGVVLEVGFGSGLNVPYYPLGVERVFAVDPATVGRKLAAKRVGESHVAVEYVDAGIDALPIDTGSIDHVLVTWTLCSIPDVAGGLREIYRVLRPGGQLHFVEHGRSPDLEVARWQDRLNSLQRACAGGCNLNRRIDQLVEEAGFQMAQLEVFYAKGLKLTSYMYEGVATKSRAG
jgi:ubiquinone/menaquinone biosynthesis C-methylase UbiE